MALEKTKIDKLISPENIKKTKRNRHQTVCVINRYKGCGICGSLNVAYQGVLFCNICGEEVETLSENGWLFSGCSEKLLCTCLRTRIGFKGKVHEYRDIGKIQIGKCTDCGAAQSSFCPNGKNHNCWKSGVGNKKFCQNCGYRK